MDEGLKFLERSAEGTELSPYHVEAAIARVDVGREKQIRADE